MSRKKWYTVTVEERYSDTYIVRAEDAVEAEDLVNELVNREVVDPTRDNPDSYDRRTYTDPCEKPTTPGAAYWELKGGWPCPCEVSRKKGPARR